MLLEIENLSVSYAEGISALRGISLSVPEGGIVTVLGNNGAGKSTLLRTIAGSLRMQGGRVREGQIRFGQKDLLAIKPAAIVRSGLALVPEGRRVFAGLTVDENLRAGSFAAPKQAKGINVRSWVEHLFPILKERRDQQAGLLSGGEQQMLAIGRALMSSPRLLLLDEPSLGLSPQLVDRVMSALQEIRAEGTAVLLVEQDAVAALHVADSAVVLDLGKVLVTGPAQEMRTSEHLSELVMGTPIQLDRRRRRLVAS